MRQLQRGDRLPIGAAGVGGEEDLMARVRQRRNQRAHFCTEGQRLGIARDVQPTDFTFAALRGQRVQHREHRGDADTRRDEDDGSRVVAEVEVTAWCGDLEYATRFGVLVQPAAHQSAILALDADAIPMAGYAAGQRIAAQRSGTPCVGKSQGEVLARSGNRQFSSVLRLELDRQDGGALDVGLDDAQRAESAPARFDSDRRRCRECGAIVRREQFGERLLPARAQRRDVDGLSQHVDVAFGQIEQRVDLGDGQLMAPAMRALDHVARGDPTFADDSEVEARTVMGDKQIRHLGLAEPHAHPEARHPRLGYLELRLADAVAVADADLVVAEAGDGEVLAEHPWHQIVTVEVAPPMVVGLGLVDHHGPLFAAVAAEVALTVSLDVQPADHHRFGHRVLVDTGVDGPAAPRHVGGHADVHRHQRRRHTASDEWFATVDLQRHPCQESVGKCEQYGLRDIVDSADAFRGGEMLGGLHRPDHLGVEGPLQIRPPRR